MQNVKTLKTLEVKIPNFFEAPHNSKFNFVNLRHDQARDRNWFHPCKTQSSQQQFNRTKVQFVYLCQARDRHSFIKHARSTMTAERC